MTQSDDDAMLPAAGLTNAQGNLASRQQAERDLIEIRDALPRSAEELTSNREWFRTVLHSIGDAVITTDVSGGVTYLNAEAQRLTGWNPVDAVGASLERVFHIVDTEDGKTTDSRIAAVLHEGSSAVPLRHVVLIAMNGMRTEIEDTVAPVRDVTGRITGAVLVFRKFTASRRDVSEAGRAHVLQARLAAIVETSDDGIIGKTLDGIVTSWNKSAERIFGYAAGEMIGRSIKTIIPVERHGEEDYILRQLRQGGSVGHFETVRMTKDGRRIDVSLSTSPILDAAGNIVGAAKIVRDVSVRKQAEHALQMETRNLELLNRTGTILSSKLDLQTLVQTVTDAATELSGARFGAFFHNTIDESGKAYLLYTLSGAPREAFETLGRPRATTLFDPTFEGAEPIRCDDVLADPRYGKMAPHFGMPPGHPPVRSYLAMPVKTRAGEVIGGLFFGHPETGVFTQRTERLVAGIAAQAAVAIDNVRLYESAQKAAEERLVLLESERAARAEVERTSELKDQFLATLSHELRTPLSAVLGWVQVLRRGARSAADLAKGLETIERNARVQAQLIEDLLDMSRITSGKMRLDMQLLEPIFFIEAAMETVRPSAEAKGVALHKQFDPASGPVYGDPDRLQQIIWNLLSNAVKFTPQGGSVKVSLDRVNTHAEISIEDTGIGIKPAFLGHVFDRFRQGDASTTRRHGGLGLGLSIVKSLVEMHGGTVQAQSTGENSGATFSVRLPLARSQRYGNKTQQYQPGAPGLLSAKYETVDLSGIRVLVVDDEADARELSQRVLSECNAEVFIAATAADALLLIENMKPDMIISDIGMPGVDGYELLKQVRALGPAKGGRLPAIALTAFARNEDRSRALDAGYLAHLSKPVEPSELIAMVAVVAGRTGALVTGRHQLPQEER